MVLNILRPNPLIPATATHPFSFRTSIINNKIRNHVLVSVRVTIWGLFSLKRYLSCVNEG